MKLWKYSGTFLLVTGIIHTLVALPVGWNDFVDMWRDGVFNSVENGELARSLSFWFIMLGLFIIVLALPLQQMIKETHKPLPTAFGWALLVLSAIGLIFVPVSGFWLFVPQGLIIVLAKRES